MGERPRLCHERVELEECQDSGAKRVWILGAGFSRSLGGPLLNDLLSDGQQTLLRARFPSVASRCEDVFNIFRWGRQGSGIAGLWPNAEAFLEFLDSAEPGTTSGTIISEALAQGPKADRDYFAGLRHRARQAITASCWGFLKDKPPNVFHEAWLPYKHWYGQLGAGDVIVTFNYDLVVERAAGDDGKLIVVTIGQNQWESNEAKNSVRLLKLHGSVNWKEGAPMAGDEVPISNIDEDKILVGPDDSVIAHPGHTKLKIAKTLELLWKYAEEAIADAQRIYLVGYSMPPSDNGSKQRLLKALRAPGQQQGREINLVLGNDQAGAAAATRLRIMLEWNARNASRPMDKVVIHSLNAEDFLLLYKAP